MDRLHSTFIKIHHHIVGERRIASFSQPAGVQQPLIAANEGLRERLRNFPNDQSTCLQFREDMNNVGTVIR